VDNQQSLIDARTRLKALSQSEDVRVVLYMVENNLALSYGRRVKAFDGAHVAREVARVLAGNQASTEVSSSPAARPAQKNPPSLPQRPASDDQETTR
jgi:hypothetical protein